MGKGPLPPDNNMPLSCAEDAAIADGESVNTVGQVRPAVKLFSMPKAEP
jgi:hypothetical protein